MTDVRIEFNQDALALESVTAPKKLAQIPSASKGDVVTVGKINSLYDSFNGTIGSGFALVSDIDAMVNGILSSGGLAQLIDYSVTMAENSLSSLAPFYYGKHVGNYPADIFGYESTMIAKSADVQSKKEYAESLDPESPEYEQAWEAYAKASDAVDEDGEHASSDYFPNGASGCLGDYYDAIAHCTEDYHNNRYDGLVPFGRMLNGIVRDSVNSVIAKRMCHVPVGMHYSEYASPETANLKPVYTDDDSIMDFIGIETVHQYCEGEESSPESLLNYSWGSWQTTSASVETENELTVYWDMDKHYFGSGFWGGAVKYRSFGIIHNKTPNTVNVYLTYYNNSGTMSGGAISYSSRFSKFENIYGIKKITIAPNSQETIEMSDDLWENFSDYDSEPPALLDFAYYDFGGYYGYLVKGVELVFKVAFITM